MTEATIVYLAALYDAEHTMTTMTIHGKCGAHSITLYASTSVAFHEGNMLVACGDGKTRAYRIADIDYVEVEEERKNEHRQ